MASVTRGYYAPFQNEARRNKNDLLPDLLQRRQSKFLELVAEFGYSKKILTFTLSLISIAYCLKLQYVDQVITDSVWNAKVISFGLATVGGG